MIQPGIDNIRIDQYTGGWSGQQGHFALGPTTPLGGPDYNSLPITELYRFCVACRPSVSQIIKEKQTESIFYILS